LIDHNSPQLAIDPDDFARYMNSGALDGCLRSVRTQQTGGRAVAQLNCGLAERLFYDGRGDDALECARRAFAMAPDDDAIAHFCAWLFSNAGAPAEAAAAYERLIAQRPDWVEGYRHLSGALAAEGLLERALAAAITASDLAPGNLDFALHAGGLLLDAERVEEAVLYLARAVDIEPENPHALRALSAAGCALNRADEALNLALQAAALAPSDSTMAIHAGELLLRAGHVDAAAALLDDTVWLDRTNPTLWRLLSTAEAQRDRVAAALNAIGRAIQLAPDHAEYHLHQGHLLYRAGDYEGAAEALAHAASLDPTSCAAQRTQIELLLADGRVTDATALGGELLRAFPQDDSSAETVLRVLNRRLDALDGDYVVLGDHSRRLPRRPRLVPGFVERMRSQYRVIQALIIRETRTRFGDSRLGYGWALIEPILHIALLSVVFSLLMLGQPPIGTHFFVFYFTGLIPYHMFVHTSSSMMHGVTSNGPLLQLPLVTPCDVILARGLLEIATDVVVATILLAGFAAVGMPALPDNLWAAANALIAAAALGCGMGFVNAVLQTLFRSWDKLWNNATRLLYFFSGIFYVPGMMPDWARDALAWNPLLHAIDWFRAAFYDTYQPHWLDRGYLVVCAIVALMAGLALERALRRRLSEPL
jgi:ABC-type polysaccharide/polyol phosphate export permease/tetratricopeptide (TPR) repeat protein